MSPGLPTWVPNLSWGVPPAIMPLARATLLLPRSRASMKNDPAVKVAGTLSSPLKTPFLSVWTKVTT